MAAPFVEQEIILPKSLKEAIEQITVLLSEDIEQIKSMTEDELVSFTHFNVGMYIRNSWQLWWHKGHGFDSWSKEQPPLNKWFNSIGIYHADDMSSILIKCFYRNLKSLPDNLDKEVEFYNNFWKKQGFADGNPMNK